MEKARFDQIKGNPTFLYEYFVEETGNRLPLHEFDNVLGMWLFSVVGVHPMDGKKIIIEFISQKFANK